MARAASVRPCGGRPTRTDSFGAQHVQAALSTRIEHVLRICAARRRVHATGVRRRPEATMLCVVDFPMNIILASRTPMRTVHPFAVTPHVDRRACFDLIGVYCTRVSVLWSEASRGMGAPMTSDTFSVCDDLSNRKRRHGRFYKAQMR